MNDVEKMAWVALSGAVLSVFWPWMLAQNLAALTQPICPDKTERD